jgi:hypothetical protein
MPKLRTGADQQVDAAVEELITLGAHTRGIGVEPGSKRGWVRLTVGRHSWPARVLARDAASLADVQRVVGGEAPSSTLLVANQISTEAKDYLDHRNHAGATQWWSWLDRRGELQLNNPRASGVVHFERSATNRRPSTSGGWRAATPQTNGPIRGRAGISLAAALLLDPTHPPSIRAVARRAEMSHGAVGDASIRLREAGLIPPSGQPQNPELFWALAAVWSPTRVTPVGRVPTQDEALRLGAAPEALDQPGWCAGGDGAAAAWGAPVFASAARPWIWVPHEGDARRVERALTVTSWDDYAAVVVVPPTVLACQARLWPPEPDTLPFLPSAHPLFLALELAQDPARGREILEQWHPEQSPTEQSHSGHSHSGQGGNGRSGIARVW